MAFPIQTLVVQKASAKKHKVTSMDAPVALVNPDGTAFSGSGSAPDLSKYALKTDVPAAYKLPAASTTAVGGVKQGAAVADAAAAPTMEEYNALLKALRDAGIIASK